MKKLLTVGAVALASALVTTSVLSLEASAHRQVTPTEFDDMWDTGNPNRRVCRHNKRKCVEIASNLAYSMARSGAYTALDDNQFAAYAIKVAAHIVDNDYTHDENEGSPVSP